jgi:hypothetical protein
VLYEQGILKRLWGLIIYYFVAWQVPESRLHLPSIDETIQQFLTSSDNIILEHYRSLSQKKHLLAKAIEINDGNAILGVGCEWD